MTLINNLIDMVDHCRGKVSTTLGLMMGYRQICMEAGPKSKTMLFCHLRLLQYTGCRLD